MADMRWQNSPLVQRVNAVVEASKDHTQKESRVADNRATQMIVHHAFELALIRDEIYAGSRDGLGYLPRAPGYASEEEE